MSWFIDIFRLTDRELAPMIRGHEITVELVRTPGLAQLLSDLQENPDFRKKTKENPDSMLKERKIKLPAGAKVELRQFEADGWEIRVKIVDGLHVHTNGFNTETGFFTLHRPQRPPKKAKSG